MAAKAIVKFDENHQESAVFGAQLIRKNGQLIAPNAGETRNADVIKRHRPVRRWVGITAVLAGVAFVAVQRPWSANASASSTAHATPAAENVRVVTIANPSPVTASDVVLPATIHPWQSTTLHARVSGYLAAWHHDLGEHVKAGDLLAEIETPELDQEVAEGEALTGEAEAAVTQAVAEKVEAEADLKVAEAQLVRVEAEAALAKTELGRREKLVVNQVVTREEYDAYATEHETTIADVAASKSDIARRKANLETRAAIIKARMATVVSRKANVARLRQLQSFKRIVAPFDGVITKRNAEVGLLVTAGQNALFEIEDASRVRVQVNVPQTYAQQTVVGSNVHISVPEAPSQSAKAAVSRVTDSVDPTNRTMLAEIEIDNAQFGFQPGSYAQVTLATNPSEAGWTIPTNTLSMRVAGPHVALVNGNNEVEMKPVSLGRDLGKQIVVVAGIQGDEQLIVNPSDSLASGLRVKVAGGNNSQPTSSSLAANQSRAASHE